MLGLACPAPPKKTKRYAVVEAAKQATTKVAWTAYADIATVDPTPTSIYNNIATSASGFGKSHD